MKTLIKKIALACLSFLAASVASANSFEYEGAYYHIISSTDLTCEITYKEPFKETETYIGDIVIPETVDYNGNVYKVVGIDNYAFYNCSGLTSITIPEGVTSIGYHAFYNCSGLTSITIPEGVTSIREYTFFNCSGLTSITIPEGVTSIGQQAFKYCSSLTSITIPEGVTSIGQQAFEYCSSLTSITIPEGVTSIREYTFSDCSALTSITIPEGVTSIGERAFFWCSSLTSITIPESVTSIGYDAFYHCSSLTSITIPEGVTSIGNGAFEYCSSLTSINIPKSVTSIGNGIFMDCSSLHEITVDDENSDFTSIKGILYSKNVTKIYCHPAGLKETTFTIPKTVSSIEPCAFFGCSSLTNIDIPSSVTTIGDAAFGSCTNLKDIVIPATVTEISYCFAFNCNLQSVYIEDGITPLEIINNYPDVLFGGGIDCKELHIGRSLIKSLDDYYYNEFRIRETEKVTFSQFVTSIDNIGMDKAKDLKTVISLGRIPPTIADDFFSVDQYNDATLYVPEGAMQAYMEAPGWRFFYNIMEGLPTGISQVESTTDGMTVTADNGCIVISNAHGLVNVYDVSGVLINSANAEGNDLRITVPGHGMYIVKAEGKTLKVAM